MNLCGHINRKVFLGLSLWALLTAFQSGLSRNREPDPPTYKDKGTLAASSWIRSLAVSPDSAILAAGLSNRSVEVLYLTTEKKKVILDTPNANVRCLGFSQDGKTLVGGPGVTGKAYDGVSILFFWDAGSWALIRTLTLEGKLLAFHPDGLAAMVPDGEPKVVKIFELQKGNLVSTLKGHDDKVMLAVFSPDQKAVATLDGAGTIRIWDVATTKVPKRIELAVPGRYEPLPVQSLHFTPEGNRLGMAMARGRLYDLGENKERPGNYAVSQSFFSPDGKLFALSRAYNEIHLYQQDGKVQNRNGLPTKAIAVYQTDLLRWQTSAIAFAPDGRHFYVGATSGVIRICEMPKEKQINKKKK
jgi:WD40 repeat protein